MRALAVLCVLGGCSFMAMDPPIWPARHDAKVSCTPSTALPFLDLGITAAVSGGLIVSAATIDPESPWAGINAIAGYTIGALVALIGVASASDGFDMASQCRGARRALQRLRVAHDRAAGEDVQRARAREEAWQRTKAATAAAQADDCVAVARIDAEVRTLDADFHVSVFVRDAAIARCLAATASGPTAREPLRRPDETP